MLIYLLYTMLSKVYKYVSSYSTFLTLGIIAENTFNKKVVKKDILVICTPFLQLLIPPKE